MHPDDERIYANGEMERRHVLHPSVLTTFEDGEERIASMIGQSITESQKITIGRIQNNLDIHFHGEDRFDAYAFINQHMTDSKLVEKRKQEEDDEAPETNEPPKKKPAKKPWVEQKARHTCWTCGEKLYEDRHTFCDIVHFDKDRKLCATCYVKRREDEDWKAKDEELTVSIFREPKPKSKATTKIETSSAIEPKKRGNKMLNNLKSVMGEFGKVTTDQFKLSFQGVAVRTEKPSIENAAAYAVYDAANNRMIDVMDFVLDAEGILYKMPVTLDQLKKGDIIIVKEKPLVVKSVNKEALSIRALNPLSNNETTHKPAGNLFGFQFITKVVSMFEMMAPGQQMNPMMMMMFTQGEGKSDSKLNDLLPLMMMGGMQGGTNPMQSMLPLMLLSGDKKEGNGMMEMLMMSQMFGGGGFGAQPQQSAQQQTQQPFGFGSLFGQGFPPFGPDSIHPNTPAAPGNVDVPKEQATTLDELLKNNPQLVAEWVKNNPDLVKEDNTEE